MKLQGQPIQILEILVAKPGELVTREEIQQRLWQADTFVDFDHSLNTAVKKLRQALGDEADAPRYIETLPKRGYRFIAEVTHEEPVDEPPQLSPLAARVEPLDSQRLVSAKGPRRQRTAFAVSAAALLIVSAGAAVYSAIKTLPQPRIVGSHALTKTRNQKESFGKPLVDRGSVYFLEKRPSGSIVLRVPVEGGEVSEGPWVDGGWVDGGWYEISRDGSQLLFDRWAPQRNQDDVWRQAFPAGAPRLIVKDIANWVTWSADGSSIFFDRSKGNEREFYRANADGTDVERLGTVPESVQPHLSPDGTRVRVSDISKGLFTLWEVGTDGRDGHAILGGRKDVFGGSWSPDGKHYFFSSFDGEHWSLWAHSEAYPWWRTDNGSPPQQLTIGPMSIGNPAISTDGKQLYAVGMEKHGELSAYDFKSRKFVPYLSGVSVCYVDFSRDGQWIAYVSYPEGTLWRSRVDGSDKRQLTSLPLAVLNPRWSPDGKLIAFWDLSNGDRSQMTEGNPSRIYVVSADGGGPSLLLAGEVGDPTWAPDGNSLAYVYREPSSTLPELRVLDLQTQKSTTVPGSAGMWSPRWSPDGRYLVAIMGPTAGPISRTMLFTFATNTWQELVSGGGGWESWSRDSELVYALEGDSVIRISISNHKKEQIADLRGFQSTAYFMDKWNGGWLGVTPDGRPISTRDTGIAEIYAFDLEYK